MDTFLVRACKGIVRNKATGTIREGFWIPVECLPDSVAKQLDCDNKTARPHLAWDMQMTGWRDMRNAQLTDAVFANAALVTLPNGQRTIAMIDF